jgi:hypothetical protein
LLASRPHPVVCFSGKQESGSAYRSCDGPVSGSEFDLEPMSFPTEDLALGFAIGIAKWFNLREEAPNRIKIVNNGTKEWSVGDLLAHSYLFGDSQDASRT